MTMRIGGLSSGIDTESIIKTLIDAEKVPITRLETKNETAQNKLTVYNELQKLTSTFQTSSYEMSLYTTWSQKSAKVTDEKFMTAKASLGAQTGTYNVTIDKLATSHRVKGTDIKADLGKTASEALGMEGTFTLEGVSIDVKSSDSLNTIRDNINKAMESVDPARRTKAYLVENTLVLERANTGAGTIELSDTTGSVMQKLGILDGSGSFANVTQEASALTGSINGVAIVSDSNTIENAIQNVTLNVKEAGTTTITVGNNTEALKNLITEFVDNYNALVSYIKQQTQVVLSKDFETSSTTDDETKAVDAVGYLQGDSFVSSLLQNLNTQMMTQSKDSNLTGSIKTLNDLGIWTTSEEGTFSIVDESKLNAALEDHFDEVANFFRYNGGTGSTNTGIAKSMDTYLKQVTDTVDGPMTLRIQNIQDEIDTRKSRIESMYTRLETYETTLWEHYASMENMVSDITSQTQYLLSSLGVSS